MDKVPHMPNCPFLNHCCKNHSSHQNMYPRLMPRMSSFCPAASKISNMCRLQHGLPRTTTDIWSLTTQIDMHPHGHHSHPGYQGHQTHPGPHQPYMPQYPQTPHHSPFQLPEHPPAPQFACPQMPQHRTAAPPPQQPDHHQRPPSHKGL